MTNSIKQLPEQWEQSLETMMLINQTIGYRRRAYFCSPLRADTPEGVKLNMRAVRAFLSYAYKYLNVNAWAPHAFVPPMLCDRVPRERALALKFGLELLAISDELHVCGDMMTAGMRNEIEHAVKLGMPITVYDECLYHKILSIISNKGIDESTIRYCPDHPLLAASASALFINEEA